MQAPHLSIAVFARGLMNHLLTRIYFEDESSTESDPILRLVPEARRTTLIARRVADESLTPLYRFDIVLQGAGETVFFDFRSAR
jgi:protocatechuate 3,4-dioxygenase alpha subunit